MGKRENEEQDFLKEHLPYEVGMLRYAHRQIKSLPEGVEWNAGYECFAVHARNLVQFLSKARATNSFIASDFATKYRQPGKSKIKGTTQMLVEQVFHPSRNRKRHSSEKVNLGRCNDLSEWIENALSQFDARVDQEYRAYWTPLAPAETTPTGPTASATNHTTIITS